MPLTIVVGATWGDEGKGKIVDALADGYDAIARYQGGPNAGHSVEFGGKIYALHAVPSGVFHPGKKNMIGNGCVVNPKSLRKEMELLKGLGLSLNGFYVSERAHLILPYHQILDKLSESSKRIGTTGQGIGQAYTDKARRIGIRFCDLRNRGHLLELVERVYENFLKALDGGEREACANDQAYRPLVVTKELLNLFEDIKPHITDTGALLRELLQDGKRVLGEGAQGTLLDQDHGTYPYSTSSNSGASGAPSGLGVSVRQVDKVIGVAKAAYITRVGAGSFPTEQGTEALLEMEKEHGSLSQEEFLALQEIVEANLASDYRWGLYHREKGNERGATTGRLRRVGYMDLVALLYSISVNGIDELALTKMDVSDCLQEIPLCTQYFDGERVVTDNVPHDLERWRANKVFVPGWQEPTIHARRFEDLPRRAQAYLGSIEAHTQTPIKIVSVGAKGGQTIFR